MNEKITECKIKAGRWISVIIIAGNLSFCIPYFIVIEITTDAEERMELNKEWDKNIAYILYSMFGLHLVCVLWLVSRLHNRRR